MQTQRRSLEANSEASYCERETWDDWGSRSTLSQLEEVTTQSSSHPDDAAALRAERDALARALAAERQRAATAARAHDARLAELHGVIAELVRRRAQDKQTSAIPEEEVSDECESTTQPAGELDNDEPSRTEQNDTSSLSPDAPDAPAGQEKVELQELPDDSTETSEVRVEPRGEEHALCVDSARCCRAARTRSGGSCERERGSPDGARVVTASPGRCESRQAKVASRVRLRKTTDDSDSNQLSDEAWCVEAAEQLALDVCAQAGLREALVAADNDGSVLCVWRARCARLQADCRVLRCALHAATDTAHKLSCACAVQESSSVALCCALRAADRALEAYDVLLALAETQHERGEQRAAAELVGRRLLARLDAAPRAAVGEPLLSPGPWQHPHQCSSDEPWTAQCEARLRAHAARLKAETVSLRALAPAPHLFSHYDIDDEDAPQAVNMAEMEAAVLMQEALAAREARAVARARLAGRAGDSDSDPSGEPGEQNEAARRQRHWLDPRASETDL